MKLERQQQLQLKDLAPPVIENGRVIHDDKHALLATLSSLVRIADAEGRPTEWKNVGMERLPKAIGVFLVEHDFDPERDVLARFEKASQQVIFAQEYPPRPMVQVSPGAPVDFGSAPQGTVGKTISMTVINSGDAGTILNVTALGLKSAPAYSISNITPVLPWALPQGAAGGPCDVTFKPVDAQPQSAYLYITSDAGVVAHGLKGTGTPAPVVEVPEVEATAVETPPVE